MNRYIHKDFTVLVDTTPLTYKFEWEICVNDDEVDATNLLMCDSHAIFKDENNLYKGTFPTESQLTYDNINKIIEYCDLDILENNIITLQEIAFTFATWKVIDCFEQKNNLIKITYNYTDNWSDILVKVNGECTSRKDLGNNSASIEVPVGRHNIVFDYKGNSVEFNNYFYEDKKLILNF